MNTPRMVASAFFDDRKGRVIVAGQVLGSGARGIEGIDVMIATELHSVVVRTSSMGTFGAQFAGEPDQIGRPVHVGLVTSATICRIQ